MDRTLKKKIAIVGSYPPPYGGISVHIQRLQRMLVGKYDVRVFDLYGKKVVRGENGFVWRCGYRKPANLLRANWYIHRFMPDLVHFHVSALKNFAFAGPLMIRLLGHHPRKVISIHSGSFTRRTINVSHWMAKSIRNLFAQFDHIVVVNEEQSDYIRMLGVPEEKLSIIPAFLPPETGNNIDIKLKIESLRKNFKVLLLASGYTQRHYGFHLILDAIKALDEEKEDIAIVFAFYNTYGKEYVAELLSKLHSKSNFAVFKNLPPDQFSLLLSLVDIYVRSTDRDGDAVAIREAAFFGKQIIASDCVERPAGTILFQTNNSHSLKLAIEKALSDSKKGRVHFDFQASRARLFEIYRHILA